MLAASPTWGSVEVFQSGSSWDWHTVLLRPQVQPWGHSQNGGGLLSEPSGAALGGPPHREAYLFVCFNFLRASTNVLKYRYREGLEEIWLQSQICTVQTI